MSAAQLPAPASKRGGARPNTGGARPGSGRKPGSQTKKTQIIAEQARDAGVTPIDVMLGNMRYYHDRAEDFDKKLEQIAEVMTPQQIAAGGEQVMNVLRLVAKIGEFRMKAQECAVDAAPYVHPRLAALAIKVESGNSKRPSTEITKAMSPQLAAEAYQALLAEDG